MNPAEGHRKLSTKQVALCVAIQLLVTSPEDSFGEEDVSALRQLLVQLLRPGAESGGDGGAAISTGDARTFTEFLAMLQASADCLGAACNVTMAFVQGSQCVSTSLYQQCAAAHASSAC